MKVGKMPKVSVIMSVYKEKDTHLCMAIESILNQNFDDFEFIITLDNPENDELKDILINYMKKDERIKLFFNETNIGLANTLNNMMKLSRAKYVARMDADDIAMPERIQKEYDYITKYPKYKVISVNKINIDEDGKFVSYGGSLPKNTNKIKRKLRYINMILHPGVMFDRDYIIKLNGYRDIVPAEDYDLWLRVVNAGGEIGLLNDYLMQYRTSASNTSTSASLKMWYTSRYVKALNRNKDNVLNKKHLDMYLKKKGCFNKKTQERFTKANKLFCSAKVFVINKHYLKALFSCCKATIISPRIVNIIINSIVYKVF